MAGDNIYNGAADNGTGVGMLLEMARAWSSAGLTLPHSVIFSAVTAEEQGLLGSEYLGQHPPVPAAQIALDINYDMLVPIGVQKEVNVNGAQRTTFYPGSRGDGETVWVGDCAGPYAEPWQLLSQRPFQLVAGGDSGVLGGCGDAV